MLSLPSLLLSLWRPLLSRRPVVASRRRTLLVLSLLVLSLLVLSLRRRRTLLILSLILLLLRLMLASMSLLSAALAAVGHGHDVGSLVEGLVKVARPADDVHVAFDGEWNDGLVEKRREEPLAGGS